VSCSLLLVVSPSQLNAIPMICLSE